MKKKNRFGAIDIGSYNCRLIIVEKIDDVVKVLDFISFENNLIKNLTFNNEFTSKNISKTLGCLKLFSEKLHEHNVKKYRCIATEACRQVINPEFFIDTVHKGTGINVEIISSNEEARLSLKSCSSYMNKFDNDGLIFDIGGGSTELSLFHINSQKMLTRSISYGVINLSEKIEIFGLENVNTKLNIHFSQFKKNLPENKDGFLAIGSCSTVTTLCAIFQNLNAFDLNKIEGFEMSSDDLIKTLQYVRKLTVSQKKKNPCIGRRHTLITNGIEILDVLLNKVPIKRIIATQKGLKDALINEISLK